MAKNACLSLEEEPTFRALLQGIADLQSSACDIGIERQDKQSSIFHEERNKSINNDQEEESLKIIKQTTSIARRAMKLIVRGLRTYATYISHRSKCFTTFASSISYIREQQDVYAAPKHLLVQWQRSVTLMDLFTDDEGLYCNKRIAQDMFDICMETFDWLRSLANNNK